MKRITLPFIFWLACILSYLTGTMILMFQTANGIGHSVGTHTNRFEAFVASLTASSTAIVSTMALAVFFGICVVLTTKVLIRVFGADKVFPNFC